MKTHKKGASEMKAMTKKGQNEQVMWIILTVALLLLVTYILFKVLRQSGAP